MHVNENLARDSADIEGCQGFLHEVCASCNLGYQFNLATPLESNKDRFLISEMVPDLLIIYCVLYLGCRSSHPPESNRWTK